MKKFTVNVDSEEIILCVKVPQHDEMEQADRIYAASIGKSLKQKGKNKLLIRSEVDSFLKTEGIWTDEDQQKVENIQKDIDDLFKKLRRGGIPLKNGREIAIQIMDKRKEIVRISSKKNLFDDVTLESIAENEKSDFLVFLCTCHPDSGLTYWSSFEEMLESKRGEVYQKASEIAASLFYGVNLDFEKTLPENKWLLKYKFVDENLNYTNPKTGEKVDKAGNPITLLQQEAINRYENLRGTIVEESPFLDEDGQPVIIDFKETQDTETLKESNEPALVLTE